MWAYKTYKTVYRENDAELIDSLKANPLPTNAVKRRINKLNRPIDLSLHRDRQLIGYNYLEYIS